MKTLFLVTFLFLGGLGFVMAQTPAKKYQSTEVQMLRLKIRQQEVQIAQKDVFIAQQNFQTALSNLAMESARVRIENKWPDDLVFNQNNLEFSEPPPNQEEKKQ